MTEPNRKHVNDEIEHIVRKHEDTFRNCPSYMTVTQALNELIRDLRTHVDATVEMALAASQRQAEAALTACKQQAANYKERKDAGK